MNETNLTKIDSVCSFNEPDSADVENTMIMMTCFILGGFGIFSNVFVIVLAVKYIARKILHFLIINMAVADTLFLIINLFRYIILPFLTGSTWYNTDRPTSEPLIFLIFFRIVLATETFLSLVIISIERYRATTKTLQLSRPLSRKRIAAVIAGSWFVAFAIDLPLLVENKTALQITFILLGVIYISIVFLSILTLRRLSKPQAIEDSLSEERRQQRKKRIRNAVKMVLCSLLLYSCCWLPFVISSAVHQFSKYCFNWSILFFWVFLFLPLINSCFSPAIYCVCLPDFREAAKELLCCENTHRFPQRISVRPTGVNRVRSTDM